MGILNHAAVEGQLLIVLIPPKVGSCPIRVGSATGYTVDIPVGITLDHHVHIGVNLVQGPPGHMVGGAANGLGRAAVGVEYLNPLEVDFG